MSFREFQNLSPIFRHSTMAFRVIVESQMPRHERMIAAPMAPVTTLKTLLNHLSYWPNVRIQIFR